MDGSIKFSFKNILKLTKKKQYDIDLYNNILVLKYII